MIMDDEGLKSLHSTIYNVFVSYHNHKKKQEKEKYENSFIKERSPMVGDIVQKNYQQNKKFSKRTGVVIRKICNQSIVMWEFTKTPMYEFDKDLRILKMENNPKPAEQFAVMSFGICTPPIFYDSYEEAEQEAKRLLVKEQRTTYILKILATMNVGDIKIEKTK